MEKKRTNGGRTENSRSLSHVCEIRNGELIRYYGDDTEFTVPDDVTTIAYDAFRNCRRLTEVTLGKRVTSIHSGAFAKCRNLRRVTFPSSLREIGDEVFEGCSALIAVLLPRAV